ncbi:tetratricopeptide repeat protein [Sorangium sp. So ce1099]|uniref:tetratricopeptide repeat protein n=1 Tax=Sorangium sp. So ce1099 TaxID=3133331 RepID=UPI003F63337A
MRPRPWLRALLFGAASCLCLCALPGPAAGADDAAATPSPDAVEKAQSMFKKGATLYESKRYALALEQFRASYAAVASPNSHLYIARCLAELGEHTEAYLEFELVAAEAAARAKTEPRYAQTEQTAQLERDELARKLALVTVTVAHPDAASSLAIAGKEVPRERWGKPYPVKPGKTEIVLRTRTTSIPQTLDLSAGQAKTIPLDAAPLEPSGAADGSPPLLDEGPVGPLSEAPSPRAYLRPYAYVAGGVGVAGLGVFTVAGLMANSTYSDLAETCRGPCPISRKDDVDAGKTQKTVANVSLVVGALGLVTGTTLFILSFTGGGAGEPQRAAASPQLLVAPGFIGVRGAF